MIKMKKKYLSDFFRQNKIFLVILFAAFIIRFFLFFQYHEVWWDSGVYIGMGKYIFSLGSAGLWEHLRPVLWPIVLGIGWKAGADVILFGRIMTFLLSIASIFVFYLITSKIFSKKAAAIASAMFAFSTIFFYMGFHLYTEIPTVFLVLLASYFFIEGRHYIAGTLFGLAFLAKFPAPLFFICALAILIYKREIRKSAYLVLGFATPVIPFLIANQVFYGNFLLPMIAGSRVINEVVGCNVLRYRPFYHYFYLILFDNPLNLFSLFGIFLFFRGCKKNFRKNKMMVYPFLCIVLPLAYFMQMHCRDYRYLMVFLPFIIMFSAYGISSMIRKRKYFAPAVFLILLLSLSLSFRFYEQNKQPVNYAAEEYFRFLSGTETELEIWAGDPTVSVYTDHKIGKIYYPIYDGSYAMLFFEYLVLNEERVGYVLLDNCGGGMMCPPGDSKCERQLNITYSYLNDNFALLYNKSHGRCNYLVYEND